ncbi:MAG: PqqD family peptide modification chaperone, partial [Terriglobales bacterium]
MNDLSSESRVKLTPDQVSSELGAEVVILHVKNGMYYGLDNVGVVIWKKLRESARVADIVASVVTEFDVDAKQCEQDVL